MTALVLVLAACASPGGTPAGTATTAPQAPQEQPTAAPEPTQALPEPTQAPAESTQAVPTTGMLPEVDPSALTGDVYSAGSSTVYPLAEAIAAEFGADGFEGEIKIDSIGSGGGFERFCKTGETDIANSSRAIKDTEVQLCQTIGREPVGFLVGLDAISVVVSNENDFVDNLTLDELGKVMSGEVLLWSEVNADWPAEPIQRFTPGTDSGTFDFFVETVIQKPRAIVDLEEAKAIALNVSENLQTSEDDNVLVQGVEGSPYAIGYFGYAYYQNNADRLKLVTIDGVEPKLETAESGEYILSRPLFLYSDTTIMQEKPQVAGYINYFITHTNEIIADVGYFPASEAKLNETRQAWLAAVE
jgi:phosphate transport system substrate-binding protein